MIRNTEKQKILIQSGQRIFTTSALALLWDMPNRASLIRTISRYVNKKILFKIYKGIYSTIPVKDLNKYEIACAIGGPFSYISGETVLVKEGVLMQEINKVTLFGRKAKKVTIGGKTYLCRYLNSKYLLNRAGIKDNQAYAVASPERAVADLRYINPNFFIDNKLAINEDKIKKLSEEIGYYDSTK